MFVCVDLLVSMTKESIRNGVQWRRFFEGCERCALAGLILEMGLSCI